MKKRLLSMLMAVLMIASLVPATALAADTTADDPYGVNQKADADKKQPGITVKDDGKGGYDVTITPFAKIKDQCKVCTKLVKNELIVADCTKAGLTVYYCGDCGKQMMNPVVTEKTAHSYKFTVVEEPTCTEGGWGYAVCSVCGKNVAILSAADAVALLPADAKEAEVKATKALFEATGHADAVLNENEDILAEDGETVLVKAKVEADHAVTIAGKAVSYDKDGNIVSATVKGAKAADVTGYTGDEYCPTCNAVIKAGTAVDSLDVAHKAYMKVIDEGEEPYIDVDGDKTPGKTDTVYCAKCDETIYGVELDYDAYFAVEPEAATPAIGAVKTEVNAKAATCCAEGYTGDTMTYLQTGIDKDGKAVGAWTVTEKGKTIDKLEHHFVKYDDKAPTCTEAGMKAEGWYVCDNVMGKDANGKDIICTETKHDLIYKAPYEVPATGHNFVETVLVAPSKDNTGLSVLKCACGAYEMDGDNVKVYTTHVGACVAADERINVKEATCLEKGYTGDVVCKICGIVITKGEETDLAEHKFVNGKCEVCGAADPDYVANPFNDVKEGDEFYKEIIWAANAKLVNGYTDGSFKAGNTITRAEVVTMLWRQAGSPKAEKAAAFTDLTEDWYKDAVAWAVEKGITTGTSATTFEPEKACTRGEIVTFLWRANGEQKATAAASFTDLTEDWYKDAVAWAVEAGVTNGTSATTFEPATDCTRGQVAAFMFRLADVK